MTLRRRKYDELEIPSELPVEDTITEEFEWEIAEFGMYA